MTKNLLIERLPKIDLHCHLDGSIDIETIRKLIDAKELPDEEGELKRLLEVPEECTGLTEYLKKFELPLRAMQTEEGLKTAAFNLFKNAAAENIRYLEVRFAPMLSTNQKLDCKKVIESVIAGIREAKERYPIYGGVIVCAMRHHSVEKNIEMLKSAAEFLNFGVCALDLAGDESAYPTKMQRELFYKAKEWGVPFTIHSGECGSIENIKEALELGAKRLGHGIALKNSPELIEICRQKGIGIEMCPSSNLQTKAVDHLNNYPLTLFLEKGLLATINTDNRMVSSTSITQELMLVYEKVCKDEAVIIKLLENAARVSFAKDHVKETLLKELHRSL